MQDFTKNIFCSAQNATFIEALYEQYKNNPSEENIPDSWRNFFYKMDNDIDTSNSSTSVIKQYSAQMQQGLTSKPFKYSDYLVTSNISNQTNISNQNFITDANNQNLITDANNQNLLQNTVNQYQKYGHLNAATMLLIESYRKFGHLEVLLDPLRLIIPKKAAELDPCTYGLTNDDMTQQVQLDAFGLKLAPIHDILMLLRKVYSSRLGFEFEHIEDKKQRDWWIGTIEQDMGFLELTETEKLQALHDITLASLFEHYLHTKFPGAKRFSIEGGESSIAAISAVINAATSLGCKEIVLGMAHRGRLSTLTGIMHKPYHDLFYQFMSPTITETKKTNIKLTSSHNSSYNHHDFSNEKISDGCGGESMENGYTGDVKYHMGISYDTDSGVHLSLMPNPSHLETINVVALGAVKAKQNALLKQMKISLHTNIETEQMINETYDAVIPLLIHGDASVSGQGTVMESLGLSGLQAYCVGGAIHIVVNNQVGFTANPRSCRSTRYCTDIAKYIEAPVIHVNGNDVDAVLYAIKLAVLYRKKFHKDVFVDIVCYRKYGHNEGDEPYFTQPIMYAKINDPNFQSPPEEYFQYLKKNIALNDDYHTNLLQNIKRTLDSEYDKALLSNKAIKNNEDNIDITDASISKNLENNKDYKNNEDNKDEKKNIELYDVEQYEKMSFKYNFNVISQTGVDTAKFKEIGKILCTIPEGFEINPKIRKQLELKQQMIDSGHGIDWGMGEAMAFGSLLSEGYNIRFTGQDVERGTFSHRHATLVDQKNELRYIPLNHIDKYSKIIIANSVLSEFGVLGYEYGYSLSSHETLVIWEAQFGDFANGAQVIIDQYISSAEAKWMQLSGIVMLLPHGYEGQGPEHTSARLERFLQLCASNNMIICNCTTPASIFHALRRQMHQKTKKPLIIMTPKSLLRHKLAISKLSDFTEESTFMPLIVEKWDGSNIQEISKDSKNSKEILIDSEIVNSQNINNQNINNQNIKQINLNSSISTSHDIKELHSDSLVKKVILCSGKIYYDLLQKYRNQTNLINNIIIVIRLEQLYPLHENELMRTLQKYTNARIIWAQEEPKNMGAYQYIFPYINDIMRKVLHKQHKEGLIYIGRNRAASPCTGYTKVHIQEQEELVSRILDSTDI